MNCSRKYSSTYQESTPKSYRRIDADNLFHLLQSEFEFIAVQAHTQFATALGSEPFAYNQHKLRKPQILCCGALLTTV